MDKIFRRESLKDDTAKTQKVQTRKRNLLMNFRVTLKEKEMINKRIEVSGLTRTEFFIQSCLFQSIEVKGNIRVTDAMKNNLRDIVEALRINPDIESLDDEKRESLRIILEILKEGFGKEDDI